MPSHRMLEIRKMSKEDQIKRLSELRIELIRMKTLANTGGSVENPSMIRETRRSIARILTAISEKVSEV